MKKILFLLSLFLVMVTTLCFAQEKPTHPRPIGLSGYLFAGQGTEKITVAMGKYSLADKYMTDTYGYAIGLDFFKLAERIYDKDIFGKWSVKYQFSTNYERADYHTYYDEKTNRYSVGYQFLPCVGAELYYKDKDQNINLSGTKVGIGLEYIGISINFRL